MGSGRSFVSAVIASAITLISMCLLPILATDLFLAGSFGGLVVQMPDFDRVLLLVLGIIAGVLTFAKKLFEKTNLRLSGFYGILRYAVGLYYAVVFLKMFGTIVIPAYAMTMKIAYLFVGALIILDIVVSMLAYIVKIAISKDHDEKTGGVKQEDKSFSETGR